MEFKNIEDIMIVPGKISHLCRMSNQGNNLYLSLFWPYMYCVWGGRIFPIYKYKYN